MKQLIHQPSLDDALAFGARAVPQLIREHWWIYLMLAILSSAFTGWGATATDFANDTAGVITFAALAGAVRLAKPGYRMRARTIFWLFAMFLLYVVGLLCVVAPITIAAIVFHHPEAALLLLIVVPVAIWISVKLWLLSPAFYVLGENDGGNILRAIADSWHFVSGAMWWRVLGLCFLIGLACLVVPGIAMTFVFFALVKTNVFFAAFVASIVYFIGAVPSTVWLQASFVALISAGNRAGVPDPTMPQGISPA